MPEEFLDYKLPIAIGRGIRSMILQGDEELDLTRSVDFVSVNADMSNKYIAKDSLLYRKMQMERKAI